MPIGCGIETRALAHVKQFIRAPTQSENIGSIRGGCQGREDREKSPDQR